MLTKIGTATNLKDLFYQYMSFLTVGANSNKSIYPWLIIDPRLDSFYGSTMVVPMADYSLYDYNIKIWVDDSDSAVSKKSCTNFYDDTYMHNCEYNSMRTYLLHRLYLLFV